MQSASRTWTNWRSPQNARRFVGAFIAAVLVLQAGVLVGRFGSRLYPFLNYSMYTRVHAENEQVNVDYFVYARLPSGEEVRILPEDLGMNFWKLFRFADRVLTGFEEDAQMLMELYEERSGRTVTALRIDSYPAIITRNGMQSAPSKTLAVVARQGGSTS